ncbi:MAG: DMT family transporter [Proteobacteria bacterium]|nr:DMT family transporter [Pseudomonadota bacterium]MDA0951237.1 DMT family transporter [Pseudomonadota bacterium]MDA1072429.1 DMT family transporter [Pseudomonadota bacterium]
MRQHPQFWPTLALLAAAAAWGLFWIPLRAFEEAGLAAGWATVAQFVVPAAVLAPIALWRRSRGLPSGIARFSSAFCLGLSFALYADSLLLTEVARTLILFYVTPAWSTILEIVFMGRRLTAVRALAVTLGLAGLYVILGGHGGLPLPRNGGDWMALASGILWAIGTLRVRQTGEQASNFENVFGFFFYGAIAALLLTLLPLPGLGELPSTARFVAFLPWLLLVAVGFLIPVMFGLLWGSRQVDPGRVGILLQMEAVCGILSAAWLTSEPFGWVEAGGTVLVISAALVEVLGNRWRLDRPPALPAA